MPRLKAGRYRRDGAGELVPVPLTPAATVGASTPDAQAGLPPLRPEDDPPPPADSSTDNGED